jgi:hypothetical protein
MLRKENIRLRKLNRKLFEHYTDTSARTRNAMLKLRKRSAAPASQLRESNFFHWRGEMIISLWNFKLYAALDMLKDQLKYTVAKACEKASARYDR